MAVDDLRCGDCGRDDFENPDELFDHDCDAVDDTDDDDPGGAAPKLIADGGKTRGDSTDQTTRTCRCCGVTWDRLELDIQTTGALTCPQCGEMVVVLDALREAVDHVLIRPMTGVGTSVAHEPSDDHPLVPACYDDHQQAEEVETYQPRERARLSDARDDCTWCFDETEEDDVDADAGEEGEKRLVPDGFGERVVPVPDRIRQVNFGLQMAEDAQHFAVEGDYARSRRLAAEAGERFAAAEDADEGSRGGHA